MNKEKCFKCRFFKQEHCIYPYIDYECYLTPGRKPQIEYKPPLGIEPKNIWKLKRMKDLASVIKRYAEETLNGHPIEINKEWLEEYNDLVWDYFGEK